MEQTTDSTTFCFSEEDRERAQTVMDAQMKQTREKTNDETGNEPTGENGSARKQHIRVVLIGKNTYDDEAVRESIRAGIRNTDAFLAVWFDNDADVRTEKGGASGKNPFDYFTIEFADGKIRIDEGEKAVPSKLKKLISSRVIKERFSAFVPVYDIVHDDGMKNINEWIDAETRRMTDFRAECDKIRTAEIPAAVKLTSKSGAGGLFMYAFLNRQDE